MKTTIELSDDLYRQAKVAAATSGRKLKDIVEEGLRAVLAKGISAEPRPEPTLEELLGDMIGIVDSGVPDLATNPKYMEDFGRDAGDR